MQTFKPLFFFLILFISSLVYAEELLNLTADQVVALQQENKAIIVDIRTEKEWNSTGVIPGSHPLQFFSPEGEFDAEKWLTQLRQLKSSPEQPVILVCRSGNRSSLVGNMLSNKYHMKNVYHLSKGIKSWIETGHKTEKNVQQLSPVH